MKVLSLYCGAGGIDEGLKQANIKTTLAIDIWKDALDTWKLNHEGETILGKVGELKSTLGQFDIVVGGPPCPSFSQANKNRDNNPVEVNHFWDIVDNIAKPKYYLMENVRGVIVVCKREPNYLVNCADYGVPQKRIRRIYTNVGLATPTHLNNHISVGQALGVNGFVMNRHGWNESIIQTSDPLFTLTTDSCPYFFKDNESLEFLRSKRSPNWFRFRDPQFLNKPCSTIIVPHSTHNEYVTNGQLYHKLTNDEKAILQGFPKNYKWYGNKTSVGKQIGNAVPPPLIKAFFQGI